MRANKKALGRAWVDGQPATLQQAHDLLRRERPNVGASTSAWVAFHEKAASLYATVAETDADHHFEALAFASIAREDAEKVRADRPSTRGCS